MQAVESAAAHRIFEARDEMDACAIPIIICFNLGGHGARRPGVAVGKSRTYSDAMELVMVLSLGVKPRKFACVTHKLHEPRTNVDTCGPGARTKVVP